MCVMSWAQGCLSLTLQSWHRSALNELPHSFWPEAN
jgi:hypothetical protein